MVIQSDMEARFGHLLQPIRDLTKNWDVDIAQYLEDYLEELEKITITFDGGQTSMNFAEAAMLIQGSACVYSKKVEYLYSLVFQVLDLLSDKKKKGQAPSVDDQGNDKDANFPKEDDEEFLSLDDITPHKNITLKEEDAENKSIVYIPQTPLSLIPFDEGEKGENPLYSKTGEMLGSRNDFKLNTSIVHPHGVLLLEFSHLSLLDAKALATSTPYPAHLKPQIDGGPVQDLQAALASSQQSLEAEPLPPPDYGGFDDHEEGEPMEVAGAEEPEKRMQLRERKKPRVIIAPPLAVDPWEQLDPFADGSAKDRPFRKGKTYKVPPGLEEEAKTKKRTRKGELKKKEKPLEPLTQFLHRAFYSEREKFPKNPLKVPQYEELDRFFWNEHKRRQEIIQKAKSKWQRHGLQGEEEEEEEDQEAGGAPNDKPDIPGDDDDDGDIIPGVNPQELHDDLFFPMDNGPNLMEIVGPMGDMELEKTGHVTAYEDLVRQHVEAFLASAAKYAQITDLSRRVAEWEEKIIPRLQEEEMHEPYDIHVYGTQVLEGLTKGVRIPFRHIVAGKPPFEVCRLFLATLQLANVGNVLISCPASLEAGMDKMELRLLSLKRHYEELAEYHASATAK